ncbi:MULTISPECIES: helix-turn-helix domain-containing protein [Anoxybacillus]|uniref:helix-turn-helix domain-containing protein n=3 Tax=Anoxybacillaceae TaxID=3120669 RepID=UPI001EDB1E8E|nr:MULTISPECIES: helix-turn-helix domain-containing protein [Anoxybacillus]MCG3083727.1 helix-turn-helix domain-containing protein [Anoxybacillus sp. LAT27]MCG5025446.1 helix-turn-helix domain-containing protein [Anoxybacillus flavithermus]
MSYYSFFSGIFQQKNPKKKQNMKGMVNMDNVKGVISKRIKQRLKQLNLKQKDLVEQTGQPKSTINKIVNGTVTPRVDLLIPISKVLDVSIDWLVANEREKQHHYESKLEEEIINILRHASEKEKIYIYFIISYIFKMLDEKSTMKKK